MDKVLVCRICLNTEVKLYDMFEYKLCEAYQKLLNIQVPPSPDGLPHHLCSFCGVMLLKVDKFQQKAVTALQILRNAAQQHLLTTNYIKSLDRKSHNLTQPYTTEHLFSIKKEIKEPFLGSKKVKVEESSDDEPLTNIAADKKKKKYKGGQKKEKKMAKAKNVKVKTEANSMSALMDTLDLPLEDLVKQAFYDPQSPNQLSDDEDVDEKPLIEDLNPKDGQDLGAEFELVELTKEQQRAEVSSGTEKQYTLRVRPIIQPAKLFTSNNQPSSKTSPETSEHIFQSSETKAFETQDNVPKESANYPPLYHPAAVLDLHGCLELNGRQNPSTTQNNRPQTLVTPQNDTNNKIVAANENPSKTQNHNKIQNPFATQNYNAAQCSTTAQNTNTQIFAANENPSKTQNHNKIQNPFATQNYVAAQCFTTAQNTNTQNFAANKNPSKTQNHNKIQNPFATQNYVAAQCSTTAHNTNTQNVAANENPSKTQNHNKIQNLFATQNYNAAQCSTTAQNTNTQNFAANENPSKTQNVIQNPFATQNYVAAQCSSTAQNTNTQNFAANEKPSKTQNHNKIQNPFATQNYVAAQCSTTAQNTATSATTEEPTKTRNPSKPQSILTNENPSGSQNNNKSQQDCVNFQCTYETQMPNKTKEKVFINITAQSTESKKPFQTRNPSKNQANIAYRGGYRGKKYRGKSRRGGNYRHRPYRNNYQNYETIKISYATNKTDCKTNITYYETDETDYETDKTDYETNKAYETNMAYETNSANNGGTHYNMVPGPNPVPNYGYNVYFNRPGHQYYAPPNGFHH